MRIGTRGSALALAQTRAVADALVAAKPVLEVEIVPIATAGDERPGAGATGPADDKSRFVKEIETALLEGRVDLAVHSAKDLPAELPAGLAIVAVPQRGDPRDTLCGADSIAALAHGTRVGTSSLRRRSQLLSLRPDLDVVELRGNVDTRLAKLGAGDCDALVLAQAGLDRLGRADEGAPLASAELTPAAGQGTLALEAREGDDDTTATAALIGHGGSLARLAAERALVEALGATCRTPVGAHADGDGDALRLSAYVGMPDGSRWVRDELTGAADDPVALGHEVAKRLTAAGARELLEEAEA